MKTPQTKPPSVSDLMELKRRVPDGDVYRVTFADGSWEIRVEFQGETIGKLNQKKGTLEACYGTDNPAAKALALARVADELEQQRAAGRKHMTRKSAIDWSTVNWNNTDSAIARHLGRTQPCVAYQRVKANKPPAPRGTRKETYNPNK